MGTSEEGEVRSLGSFLLAPPRVFGLLVGLFAYAAWLEPTLWPRNLVERAFSLAVAMAVGYGIGAVVGAGIAWAWRALGLRRFGSRARLWTVIGMSIVVVVLALLFWQLRLDELSMVAGAPHPSVLRSALLIGLATILSIGLVMVGRGVVLVVYRLDRLIAGSMSASAAHITTALLVVGAGLIVVVAGASAVWAVNRDVVEGPDLTTTPQDISLVASLGSADGWSASALTDAFEWADEAGATSVVVLHEGRVVAEWGDTALVSDIRSVRKSVVSVLYGIAIERGLIDPAATLADLGIDDVPPLTEPERQATIEHIITARSGIYHPSIMDDDAAGRPPRGSSAPGQSFYYNNWDFNAAGGIFEELTGVSLGRAIRDWVALPIGMEDFAEDQVMYVSSTESRFPADRFLMSTRDLARFGLLMERGGRWGEERIVSAEWIERTTDPHWVRNDGVGYAHMWWTDGEAFFASGTGGQRVYVDPERDLVVAMKVNTGSGMAAGLLWFAYGPTIPYTEFQEFIGLLRAAAPASLR
jgi:CubicO group peptidase (beta-lactamase class C family)